MEDEDMVAVEIGNEMIKFIAFAISIIFLGVTLYWGEPNLLDSIINFLNSYNCPKGG